MGKKSELAKKGQLHGGTLRNKRNTEKLNKSKDTDETIDPKILASMINGYFSEFGAIRFEMNNNKTDSEDLLKNNIDIAEKNGLFLGKINGSNSSRIMVENNYGVIYSCAPAGKSKGRKLGLNKNAASSIHTNIFSVLFGSNGESHNGTQKGVIIKVYSRQETEYLMSKSFVKECIKVSNTTIADETDPDNEDADNFDFIFEKEKDEKKEVIDDFDFI